ncbi:YbaK/EbsC family protein [Pseudorhodoferax sp.]|jgi:prolyl-tRNA editing enzyme YbaK/EbsC (Cys-tRNA(Pro) deacylase)|uniref:YbaK/EbsC family protein n=1 Tax=Pseudorhodoferax sp. TaxID=1993553 RepID=UPI001B71DE1E|nr:YbaK/EbsC family protein [Pseudorhodoferax sp.]MBP8144185.1 YbaK/EbsC family protein [Inhella sp.]
MTETQHPAVARVAAALRHAGHAHGPQWLQDSAHTAQQAADSLGVALGAIAKSVVLALPGGAVLCVTAGDRRVDASRLPQQLGAVGRADAAHVRRHTGFAIGGVAPLGFEPEAGASAPTVLIDPSLWRFAEVWAAAGHPRSVFAARPDELLRLAGAQAHDFTESAHV